MSILDLFRTNKKNSANIAKDRLLQLIVDERVHSRINKIDIDQLQQQLVAVIANYLPINEHKVQVEVKRNDALCILELNVVLPEDV